MSDFEELVRVFRKEATERLDELVGILSPALNSALQPDALRSARATAHNLKGAALTVGAQILAGPCEVFEEEIQTALNTGKLPGKVQLETWVQILAELKDIIGNPTLLPINLDGLAELENGILDDADYVQVSSPSASASALVASNGTPSSMRIDATRLEAVRAYLVQVKAAEIVLGERVANLQSVVGGTSHHERAEIGGEDILNFSLSQLTESSQSLHALFEKLQTLFDEACNGG